MQQQMNRLGCIALLFASLIAVAKERSSIQSLLKKEAFTRVTRGGEIISSAKLEKLNDSSGLSQYSFYNAMTVRADARLSREVLTRYEIYKDLVPFVEKSQYDSKTKILEISGGLWGFYLRSFIQFEEISPEWIHFKIVRGHFQGMTGDMYFEAYKEGQSLVYLGGSQQGKGFPPAFILERGAEYVFRFTAQRMKSRIEEEKRNLGRTQGSKTEKIDEHTPIPTPRNHL